MNSMMIFEVVRNGEVVGRVLVQKVAKRNNSGQIPEDVPVQVQGCTGTAHQRPTCTGTGPTCTDTGQQNATCTGTGPRCTGTGVLKMPRLCSFCIIKPKFILH